MQREISLARSGRRYFNVGGLLGPQTVPKRVEDLSLGESSNPGGVIGSDILGAREERTNVELLDRRVAHAIQPSLRRWIRAAAVTIAAGVTDDEESTMRYLVLSRLAGLHAGAAAR